jgi:hypothetical protein
MAFQRTVTWLHLSEWAIFLALGLGLLQNSCPMSSHYRESPAQVFYTEGFVCGAATEAWKGPGLLETMDDEANILALIDVLTAVTPATYALRFRNC